MTLSELSIRRPVFAWMLMAALIIFGAISFMRMGVSQMPDVDFPVLTVNVTYAGASPEIMETDVVDVIEDAVSGVEGIKQITSNSYLGSATITIEFELNRNIDVANQEVQAKITQAQRLLPKEMDPPTIVKTNPEDQPILWLALTSDKHTPYELMVYTRDHLKDKFSVMPGVGEVVLGGYLEPNMRIWPDKKKLNYYNLSVTDIINTIENEHSEKPAGILETDKTQTTVRTLGEGRTPVDFDNMRINTRGGAPNFQEILLKQVAKSEEGLADVTRISRSNGKSAVGMGIRKQRGTNAVAVAQNVKNKLAEIKKTLPEGMDIAVRVDSTKFIKESVNELTLTLVLAALLTGLVCWAFLGSWTSTLNILLAIPTSIVGTFIILSFAGFTLNTFTLMALSLSIGIVVDDAIMVLENIIRHMELGSGKVKASLIGSREITFAAMAATVAIVAIFLPVAFMKGIIGKFFFQFGVTMTAAVLLSLLEALTLTPMRCAQFVDIKPRTTRIGRGIEAVIEASSHWYKKALSVALNHQWSVIVFSVVFFASTMYLVKYINKEMVPPEDQSQFLMRLKTPAGSSLAYMDGKTKEVEKFLLSRPELSGYFTAVGGFGAGGLFNTANVFVALKNPGERGVDPNAKHELNQFEFMDLCRQEFKKIPDLRAFIQDLSMRSFSTGTGFPVEFTVRGPDWSTLVDSSDKLIQAMSKSGLMTDVGTDIQKGQEEIDIIPDRLKAAELGVSVLSISQTIQAMIGGLQIDRYSKNGHRYYITVELPKEERVSADQIPSLYVRNNRGELISLAQLVKIEKVPSLQYISRADRERAITVYANIAKGKSQADALAAVEKLADQVLPKGYHIVMSGSAQTFRESFLSLIFALGLGILVSYMVLASQFNSYADPVTVLVALPFSLSGAFMTLLLAHQSLNIYSMIGLILLMGIVKKNSILLVEFTNQMRERGLSVREALLEACPIRLRPISMTSIATIAGAVPAALSIGPGAETRMPMAIAVIGGVIVSTALTLFVVPCVYMLLAKHNRHDRKSEVDDILAEMNAGALPSAAGK